MGQVCFTAISSNRACPTVFVGEEGGGVPSPLQVPPPLEMHHWGGGSTKERKVTLYHWDM